MVWEILGSSLLSFVLGIFSALFIKRWEIRHLRPLITIEDRIVCKDITLDGETFTANRIRVRNKGRSGAQDCKAYVEIAKDDIERTGWMLPDNENSNSVMLNVDMPEYIDLCAIMKDDLNPRVLTNERGYKKGTVLDCRMLPNGVLEATLRVTSSNAQPEARRIRIYDKRKHFPNDHVGRIVEFIS